jgi:hypothetical protein
MADKRAVTYTTYARQSDSIAFQIQVAEAAMKIETAHLHIARACDEVQRYAEARQFPDYKTRARMRCDTAYGIRHALDALNMLMTAHGRRLRRVQPHATLVARRQHRRGPRGGHAVGGHRDLWQGTAGRGYHGHAAGLNHRAAEKANGPLSGRILYIAYRAIDPETRHRATP